MDEIRRGSESRVPPLLLRSDYPFSLSSRYSMSSPEYLQRLATPFVPPTHTLAQVRAAVPKELYEKSTIKSLGYVLRNVVLVVLFSFAALHIDDILAVSFAHLGPALSKTQWLPPSYNFVVLAVGRFVAKWALWVAYWGCQGLAGAGLWCLGHEAGHGTTSPYSIVNDVLGYLLHTSLLVPYYSWRSTHHAHHRTTASVERDENYSPSTRSSLNLPPRGLAHRSDYHDILEETPVYTLARMIFMQLLGWQAYLLYNAMGSPLYPPGTNHFNPKSKLFKPKERLYIHLSNLGLVGMSYLLFLLFRPYGVNAFVKFYFVPYLLSNHWIVMLTYLHHTDPSIPHYHKEEWSYLRGAAATVDRPLLGWLGRFILYNVSHDHVAHHHFPMIPFYNQPKVTEAIKPVLGHSYNYDSSNTFYALYRSFNECQFIEEDDGIAFYKNKDGEAQRGVSPVAVLQQS